jgi:hypothetical protein
MTIHKLLSLRIQALVFVLSMIIIVFGYRNAMADSDRIPAAESGGQSDAKQVHPLRQELKMLLSIEDDALFEWLIGLYIYDAVDLSSLMYKGHWGIACNGVQVRSAEGAGAGHAGARSVVVRFRQDTGYNESDGEFPVPGGMVVKNEDAGIEPLRLESGDTVLVHDGSRLWMIGVDTGCAVKSPLFRPGALSKDRTVSKLFEYLKLLDNEKQEENPSTSTE